MKLSEKKKSVAGKMTFKEAKRHIENAKYEHGTSAGHYTDAKLLMERRKKGRASLPPVKHKVDVAGQESYKEEDK